MSLNKQEEKMNELSKLIENSMDTILCGPTCQKMRVENELEQKYINAQMNLETAPIILEDTKRNYYIFKEGESYYNDILENELKEKIDEITKKIKKSFNKQINDTKVLNNYYESNIINSKNSEELYNSYVKENKYLEKLIKNDYGDILTNNRKTYYSSEGLEKLKQWYRILWYIYYILVIIIILGFLLGNSNLSIIKKIVISLILLVYPYIIVPIVKWLYYQLDYLYNRLPKNVYNKI
jgi:hypothetical protein